MTRTTPDRTRRENDHVRMTTLQPRLVVGDVDSAVRFYATVFGATETFRFTEPSGSVATCELEIDGGGFSLAQANAEYGLHDPLTVGDSPALVRAIVTDAVGTGEAMVAGGATVVVPIRDRRYGKVEGRVRDPFGHLWVLSQDV